MRARVSAIMAGMALCCAPAVFAQDAARPYDNGPVWNISAIQTKPGHFDDYMRWLDGKWRANNEDLKSRGVVLDYKVLSVADARDNEPNLFLMVEFKNMAAMDVSLDTIDAMTKKQFGSMAQAAASDVERETMRTERGDMLVRELILK